MKTLLRLMSLLAVLYGFVGLKHPNAPAAADDVFTIFRYGYGRGLVGMHQYEVLTAAYNMMNSNQRQLLRQTVNIPERPLARFFVLKSFLAGESYEVVARYAQDLVNQSDNRIFAWSTMRDDPDLLQQWNDACGLCVLQTALGELDPRFAWELNKLGNITDIDPYGKTVAIANQQKEWLEAYGGIAVLRGKTGGKGIAIGDLLNDKLGYVADAQYETIAISNVQQALNDIAALVTKGHIIPFRVQWASSGNGHFSTILGVRNGVAGYDYLIHEVWTGKTTWVSGQTFVNELFTPFFNEKCTLTHYYRPNPYNSFDMAKSRSHWGLNAIAVSPVENSGTNWKTPIYWVGEKVEVKSKQTGKWVEAVISAIDGLKIKTKNSINKGDYSIVRKLPPSKPLVMGASVRDAIVLKGDKVEVLAINRQWYKASILKVEKGHCQVHYEGQSVKFDGWVAMKNVRKI